MSIIACLYASDDSCFLANSSITSHSINSRNIVLSLYTDLALFPNAHLVSVSDTARLDRRHLAHCEGDAPPRVKEITEGRRDDSGAARQPEQALLATGKNTALALSCLLRPSVNLVNSV